MHGLAVFLHLLESLRHAGLIGAEIWIAGKRLTVAPLIFDSECEYGARKKDRKLERIKK